MKAIFLQRQQQLLRQLTERQLDGLLILGHENIQYITGFTGNAAYAIITAQHQFLITDYRYFERAQHECQGFEVVSRDRDNESLGACIDRHLFDVNTLGFDAAFINVSAWQAILSELGKRNVQAVTGLIERQRMVKDDWEIKQTKLAAAIADQALAETMGYFKAGVTEREVALELEYRLQKLGSQGMAFSTIMLFAERTSLPHGNPGEQLLHEGDFITLDFGAVINGYRSDMTRSYILGAASTEQKAIYDTVSAAQQAAVSVLKPGVNGHDVYLASQAVLQASAYGQWAGEGLGHGVGLFLHEQPILGPKTDYCLEPGNIITIEPGIYIPGLGGVRLEDDYLITQTGCQVLTHAPKPFEI